MFFSLLFYFYTISSADNLILYDPMEKMKSSSSVINDVVTIVMIVIAVLGLSVQFHIYDKLFNFILEYQEYYLKEIFVTLTVLSVLFALFSYRRWNELNEEVEEHTKAESARAQSEQRSEALLTSIPNLTFRIHRDGTYLDFRAGNPDDMYNSPDMIIGHNIRDRLPKKASDIIMHHIDLALSTNQIQTYEYDLEIKGRTKYFQARMIACGNDEVFVLVRNRQDSDLISAELAQSETRFQEVVESLSEGLLITDLHDNVIYMNQRMSELCGWTFSEVQGKPAYSLLLPQELWEQSFERNNHRREGFAERYEVNMIRKEGTTFWAELYGSPLREVGGSIVGTIGTVTDITERKWNERLQSALFRITEITRSSEDMQHLFANLHAIIGELMYAKNFYIALYDPVSDMISFPYFVDEVDSAPASRKFSHGSTEYILQTGNILHAPAPVFDEMSSQGELDLIGAPAVDWLGVPLTSAGKTFGVITIQSYDPKIVFTEREKEILIFVSRHIATAIQKKSEEERFRVIWEHSADGMRVTDKEGIIVMVNEAYCALVQKEKKELLGKLFTEVYDRTKIDVHSGEIEYQNRFTEQSPYSSNDALIHLWNGRTVNVDVTSSFITFGINERMVLGIFRDTTERKKLEDQLLHSQKMDSIGVLAGGIAHDFNNVLAMIMGAAELVKHKSKSYPDILKFAHMISSAAERGSGIAKQLLMFARTEKGVMKPISLSAIVLDVCKLLEHSISKTVSIQTDFQTANDVIMGDEDQLHQVIVNLAVNARDAIEHTKTNGTLMFTITNSGGPPPIRKNTSSERELYVNLHVSDTGSGMDETTIQRIYEPFFSTKERGKGTGLGLSIVHGIVKTHNGMIDVVSDPGKGTTFTLRFPATHIVEEFHTVKPIVAFHNAEYLDSAKKKIMVVDDEPQLAEMLREILATEGFDVMIAHDGVKALELFAKEKGSFDIIMSDLGMPNMDGRELLHELRRRDASANVVFMTGYLDQGSKQELMALGVNDVLMKPFSFESVVQTIRKVCTPPHAE
jgi:PAS domain S-box-containing protein